MKNEPYDADDDPHAPFRVSFTNMQSAHPCDQGQLLAISRAILADSRFRSAAVSIAVVDDATIHDLNRRYLGHDYPTDVLSFTLDEEEGHLEGEIVASADTAAQNAPQFGWTTGAELALYIIHGTLHLTGLRDETEEQRKRMRAAEDYYLRELGIERATSPSPQNSLSSMGGDNGS